MPRPPKLNNPRIVPIIFENEQYLLLKEVAEKMNRSISDIIRELVDEFLAKHGLIEKKVVVHDAGFNVLRQLEYNMVIMDIEELLPYLRRDIEIMRSAIPKSREWINARNRARRTVKKLYALIQKLGVTNNKKVREAIKLINEFQKCIKPE